MTTAPRDATTRALLGEHSRQWGDFEYVYPVISRRSHGLSIGINLSPGKACNFNCAYCQVQRGGTPDADKFVDLETMQVELEALIDLVQGPRFWETGAFAGVAPEFRRLDNIAFSGDGEPTLCRWFEQAVAIAAAAKVSRRLEAVKLVLITNASRLQDPGVQRGLALLYRYGGEVWAKLDAGSEAAYREINRGSVPLPWILDNLRAAGRQHPLVIQSMFLRRHGQPPTAEEVEAYLACLAQLRADGCRLSAVQLYTVARQPAEAWVAPLDAAELDALALRFRGRLPDLPVQVFYAA